MIVNEARSLRCLLVRVEPGEDVLETLVDLAHDEEIDDAWVRGIGTLKKAELEPGGRFQRCRILTLEGTLSMRDGKASARLHVTLSRPAKDGVVGGKLLKAESVDVELRVECWQDAKEERAAGRWTAPDEAHEPAEAPAVSWADVAEVSAAPEATFVKEESTGQRVFDPPPDEGEEIQTLLPVKGDFIHHRMFGLCKVDRPDKGGGVVIRLPSGIRKTIRFDFMDVGAPRMEGSRRVFPVRPRKR